MRFFEELERGKITYEGTETIRTLMPDAFAEVQQRAIVGLSELMSRGVAPPYRQRERLGILLGVAAVPSQRPEHMRLLQSNLLPSEQSETNRPAPSRGPPIKAQQTTLDRLEAG